VTNEQKNNKCAPSFDLHSYIVIIKKGIMVSVSSMSGVDKCKTRNASYLKRITNIFAPGSVEPELTGEDLLIINNSETHLRIFNSNVDVTIAPFASERLNNLGLCSALRAFQREGIFIVPHLL
jgi:hypothetical protein